MEEMSQQCVDTPSRLIRLAAGEQPRGGRPAASAQGTGPPPRSCGETQHATVPVLLLRLWLVNSMRPRRLLAPMAAPQLAVALLDQMQL